MKASTIGGCLAVLLGLGLALPALAHTRATTERVSVDSTGTQANGFSLVPAISADGRYVAVCFVCEQLGGGR
jgi:hypothetical protein